jgi:Tfp pilus assembly protein PilO
MLMLLIVLWLAIALPLINLYAARAQEISDRAALLRRQLALVAELPAFEQAAQRAGGAAPVGDTFLAGPTDAIAGATLEQSVQAMASRGGAALASAETLAPKAEGHYQRIQLRVTVTGDWSEIIALLQAVTTSRPVMLVDDLQVAGVQTVQAGAPPINAVFTVIAFRDATAPGDDHKAGTSSITAP